MTLLRAEGLHRAYPLGGGRVLRAVDGIDLAVARGETLAIVGESGCGKSTLGRLLLRLEEADTGRILLDGTDMRGLRGAALQAMRRRVQVVFQDPYGSLDPRERIGDALVRPMLLHRLCDRAEARRRAGALLERVGLSAAQLGRLPHEFSGGQRQRIAIARALAVEPALIVCDEPVSALDVSVQAQVVNLLQDLQRDSGVALVFISHDLAVVRHLAHQVAVMYAGRVVERGPAAAVFADPRHPYTRALLAAAPRTDTGPRPPAPLAGEPPNPAALPPGCRFAARCPAAQAVCRQDPQPVLRPLGEAHDAACHFAETLPPFDGLAQGAGPPPALAARLAAYRAARQKEIPPCA
jgi:oligopeptide/dipeptide ABC transporter ATP-binding protein